MQVDPIKPTLKAPETKRLKLKHDEPLSNDAFNLNLRRYTELNLQHPTMVKRMIAPLAKSVMSTA